MISHETMRDGYPRVAIIGRPNVGKSTLFNALVGKRRSITSSVPGVTRDVIDGVVTEAGSSFILIDTGGIQSHGDYLNEDVRGKAFDEVEKSSLVLFIAACGEWTSEDKEIARFLLPHRGKTLLVVNKTDTPERESDAWNLLLESGYSELLPISAAHRSGLSSLLDAVIGKLPDSINEEIGAVPVRMALVGRPNSGKSTLANKILGEEASLVSPHAGTTRDVVIRRFAFGDTTMELHDTAGMRRKSRVGEDIEYYSVQRAVDSLKEVDVSVLLIDAEEGLGEQDKKIAGLVVKRGKGLVVGVSKIDLVPEKDERNYLIARIRDFFPSVGFAPIIPLSGVDGAGIRPLLKEVIAVSEQLRRRIPTSPLNEAVEEWQSFQPIPSVGSRRYKIRYITQVSSSPLVFMLFVNRAKGFPEPYRRFIINRLRSEFGFEKVPLKVEIRDS